MNRHASHHHPPAGSTGGWWAKDTSYYRFRANPPGSSNHKDKEWLTNNLDNYIYSLAGQGTTKHAKSAKMMTGKILFKEQSYRIIGACFEAYKEKGNGFLEAAYQACLARELAEQEILFEEQAREAEAQARAEQERERAEKEQARAEREAALAEIERLMHLLKGDPKA